MFNIAGSSLNIKIISLAAVVIITVVASSVYVSIEKGQNRLTISTTTSLYDTKLLDTIAESYLALYKTKLDFISAGTGMALEHARRGDADVVLVHAPSTENKFLSEGVVGARKIIAYNFFAIVGPREDPAGISGLSPLEALKKIASMGAIWVSRGDNSGTHTKEKSLWKSAGIQTSGQAWYLESGTGMGQTLMISNERRAYTLADTGTYLKYYTDKLIDLEILVERGKELLNVYSVMAVNPSMNPNVKFDGAIKFIEFLISDNGQTLIGDFGREQYGVPLFYPAVQILKGDANPEMSDMIRGYAFLENSECPVRHRLDQEQLYR